MIKYDLAPSPPMATVKQFAAEEAARAGIGAALVISRDTRRAVTWARQRVMKRLLALGYSPAGIAFTFDVDHSTVYHAVNRELPECAPPLLLRRNGWWVSRARPRRAEHETCTSGQIVDGSPSATLARCAVLSAPAMADIPNTSERKSDVKPGRGRNPRPGGRSDLGPWCVGAAIPSALVVA